MPHVVQYLSTPGAPEIKNGISISLHKKMKLASLSISLNIMSMVKCYFQNLGLFSLIVIPLVYVRLWSVLPNTCSVWVLSVWLFCIELGRTDSIGEITKYLILWDVFDFHYTFHDAFVLKPQYSPCLLHVGKKICVPRLFSGLHPFYQQMIIASIDQLYVYNRRAIIFGNNKYYR